MTNQSKFTNTKYRKLNCNKENASFFNNCADIRTEF